jgi:hypothetical protein
LTLLSWILVCLAFPATGQCTPEHPPLLAAPFWNDGKAEVSIYAAQRFHYGRLYPSEVRHYLVKEPFSLKEFVKSDDPSSPDTVTAIKLNQTFSTPTGTYDYQQMHSTFWDQQSGQLLKFAMSHHEACGASYKQGEVHEGQLDVRGSTYWQGDAAFDTSTPISPLTWLYEELPLQTRILVADQLPAPTDLKIIPPMVHSKAGSFQPQPATLEIDGTKVTVTHPGGTDVLTFSPDWPHVLQSWQQADGGSLTLKKSMRLAYWAHHRPADEALLKK